MSRFWAFLLVGLVYFPVWAVESWVVQRTTRVYKSPEPSSPILFEVAAGERIEIANKRYGVYRRIRVRMAGRVRLGFILATDLTKAAPTSKKRDWGLGVAGSIGQLSQEGKSFETQDQVQYKTSEYTSRTPHFSVMVQGQERNFWRAYAGLRSIDFTGEATTNVVGSSAQKVRVQYSMWMLGVQKAWSIWRGLYLGAGLEVARANSAQVTLGNQNIPTTSEDQPTYLLVQMGLGWQFHLAQNFTIATEWRMGYVPNQSPAIQAVEVGAFLLYWL